MPWRKEVLVLQEDWSALEFELLPFVHLQWRGQLQCAATCAGIAPVPFGSSLEGCACWVFWCLGEFSLFFCYVFSTFHSPICPLAQLPLSSTSWVSSILASFETQLQKTAAVGNVCVCRHHVFNEHVWLYHQFSSYLTSSMTPCHHFFSVTRDCWPTHGATLQTWEYSANDAWPLAPSHAHGWRASSSVVFAS